MPALTVGEPCPAYAEMARRWRLIEDLRGGTERMREEAITSNGENWCWNPRFKHENSEQYHLRIRLSVLFEGYSDTVAQIVAKPFSGPFEVRGELPEEFDPIIENADGAGTSLRDLANGAFEDGIHRGLGHFLVDMPSVAVRSLQEEQELGIRPTIVFVSAKDLIGWKTRRTTGGRVELAQIRIREMREEEDAGAYGTVEVEHIRVINAPSGGAPGTWEVWRKSDAAEGGYSMAESGTHPFDRVPIETFALRPIRFMVGYPAMEALAWVNLRHWQSSSDQSNILRFARVATPWGTGLTEDDQANIAKVGWANAMFATSAEARFGMLEHSGAAVKAGAEDLLALERRMEILGMKPLVERVSDSTAAGVRDTSGRSRTLAQVWISRLEDALTRALRLCATQMASKTLPDDVAVDIYSDFIDLSGDPAQQQNITGMWQAGLIDRKTALVESQRRKTLSDEWDPEEIMERTAEEGPKLSALTATGPFGAKPEDPGDQPGDEPPPDDEKGADDAAA